MTGDQNSSVSFQGAQPNKQVVNDLQANQKPADQGQGAEPNETITNETENLSKTISKEVEKQVQSFTDRLTAHIDKRFDSLGAQPQQQIVSDNQQQVGQINDPAVAQAMIEAQKVTNIALQEMDDVGVRVMNNDPEASMIDRTSEAAYIRSCRTAAEAKKKRLETPSEGRLPGLTGSGQYQSNEDAETLAAELEKIQSGPNPFSSENKKKRKEITARLDALRK